MAGFQPWPVECRARDAKVRRGVSHDGCEGDDRVIEDEDENENEEDGWGSPDLVDKGGGMREKEHKYGNE